MGSSPGSTTRWIWARQLTFGPMPTPRRPTGRSRPAFEQINARPVILTSLGKLVLDSGQGRLVLFGVQSDDVASGYALQTGLRCRCW